MKSQLYYYSWPSNEFYSGEGETPVEPEHTRKHRLDGVRPLVGARPPRVSLILGANWRYVGLGAMTVAIAAVCASCRSSNLEGVTMQSVIDPAHFSEHVVQAGGHVDFVFEDDRPFASCHASTVVEAGDGSLLCAWFGGTHEKDPDVGIWMSRYSDGKWAPCRLAAKVGKMTAHWNPVLFRDPAAATVYLFFKVGVDVPPWQTYWMRSEDNGATWTTPVELVPGDVGGRGPVKNKPIVLSDGAWLAPASTEAKGWKPFADRSEDRGVTWRRTEDFRFDRKGLRCVGGIQPTFWESPPGRIHALIRTACGNLVSTESRDCGLTWEPVHRTDLPNNNSGVDALRLGDGRVLLVYNPVGRNWGKRTPLTLAVSTDNGKTWKNLAHLETAPGEYSYPAIVSTSRGVAISYTWKRERVRCWQIPLSAL